MMITFRSHSMDHQPIQLNPWALPHDLLTRSHKHNIIIFNAIKIVVNAILFSITFQFFLHILSLIYPKLSLTCKESNEVYRNDTTKIKVMKKRPRIRLKHVKMWKFNFETTAIIERTVLISATQVDIYGFYFFFIILWRLWWCFGRLLNWIKTVKFILIHICVL